MQSKAYGQVTFLEEVHEIGLHLGNGVFNGEANKALFMWKQTLRGHREWNRSLWHWVDAVAIKGGDDG